jgi:hypothetical protein
VIAGGGEPRRDSALHLRQGEKQPIHAPLPSGCGRGKFPVQRRLLLA